MTPVAARALLALGAYAAVSVLVYAVRDHYVAAWLPAIGAVVDALLPADLARTTLGIVVRDGQQLIALDAALVRPVHIGGAVVPAGETVNAVTLAVYPLQHPALIYAVLAAWPCSIRRRAALLALGVPAIVVATLLDVPFVLAGLLHELLLDAGVTQGASPLLAVYYEAVHRGGRAALAIAAAVAIGLLLARPAAEQISSAVNKKHIDAL